MALVRKPVPTFRGPCREAKKGRAAARFFNSGSRAGPRAPRCVDQNQEAGKGESRPGWGQASSKETLRFSGVIGSSLKDFPAMTRSLRQALPNVLAAMPRVSMHCEAVRADVWERERRDPHANAP